MKLHESFKEEKRKECRDCKFLSHVSWWNGVQNEYDFCSHPKVCTREIELQDYPHPKKIIIKHPNYGGCDLFEETSPG